MQIWEISTSNNWTAMLTGALSHVETKAELFVPRQPEAKRKRREERKETSNKNLEQGRKKLLLQGNENCYFHLKLYIHLKRSGHKVINTGQPNLQTFQPTQKKGVGFPASIPEAVCCWNCRVNSPSVSLGREPAEPWNYIKTKSCKKSLPSYKGWIILTIYLNSMSFKLYLNLREHGTTKAHG